MKRLSFLIIILGSIILPAKADLATIAAADSAYMADEFQTAVELYSKAISEDGPSAKLYYNLGNSYYRTGQPGKAILAYERSLRLDPTDRDARENLEFVNERITDRPGERGTFIGNSLDAASASMRSDTWAWIAFGAFLLTAAGVLTYLFTGNIGLRKLGFFGGIATFILCLISTFFAIRSASVSLADDSAIITSPSTILSTAPRFPRDRSQEAMLLHEGTKVQILDSVKSTTDSVASVWYDVQIDNSHRAWINSKDVEII